MISPINFQFLPPLLPTVPFDWETYWWPVSHWRLFGDQATYHVVFDMEFVSAQLALAKNAEYLVISPTNFRLFAAAPPHRICWLVNLLMTYITGVYVVTRREYNLPDTKILSTQLALAKKCGPSHEVTSHFAAFGRHSFPLVLWSFA